MSKRQIVFLTGMAGAGLSSARTALQDAGFDVIDNLPLGLIETVLAQNDHPLALGIDARTSGFDANAIVALLKTLNARDDIKARLLFLDCEDGKLLGRFSESRRPHPLAKDKPVIDGLSLERELLQPLKNRADVLIDTSDLAVTELRNLVAGHFPPQSSRGLMVQVMSFSYRHGAPREADLVFDMRFLRNPHYDAALRPQTGQDAAVGTYIEEDAAFAACYAHITGLLEVSLPGYSTNGRSYLTIAFGCTGGKHRSVYLAEKVAGWLGTKGYAPRLLHRELARTGLLK